MDDILIHRVRAHLSGEPTLREVRMFGGLSFMVRDQMVVAARKESLLVRVDPEQGPELAQRPGAAQAQMGKGRDMGPSWIDVAADALDDDAVLAEWIDVAMVYNTRDS